jgi:hypothetical protein
VIGDPGAFVMIAENFNSFSDVLVKKLTNEIAQVKPRKRAEAAKQKAPRSAGPVWSIIKQE